MLRQFGCKCLAVLDLRDAWWRSAIILLGIYVVFYFGELSGFTLSIDDELAATRVDASIWVAQGRWLAYLIEQFAIGQPVVPFFPGLLFGCCVSLGYLLVLRAHGLAASGPAIYAAFGLFAAFPTLYFILDFAGNTPALALGFLLACGHMALFGRIVRGWLERDLRPASLAVLFGVQFAIGAAAIGAYQSLILLCAVGCCGVFMMHFLRTGMRARDVVLLHAGLGASLLLSIILSALISRGFQAVLAIQPVYVEQFQQIDQLFQNPLEVVGKTLEQYARVYGGTRKIYGSLLLGFPLVALLGIAALVLAFARRGAGGRIFIGLYAVGMTAIPFSLHLVTDASVPVRALVAVPYVMWFLAAAILLCPAVSVRRVGALLVALALAQCLYVFAQLQAAKQLALSRDLELAGQVYQRIAAEIPDFDREKVYRVDFYGGFPFKSVYPQIASSTLSASFFEWEGGNPYRIVAFMQVAGYPNLAALDPVRRKELMPVAATMPIWPAPGAVRVVGGDILVRLGPTPGAAHSGL